MVVAIQHTNLSGHRITQLLLTPTKTVSTCANADIYIPNRQALSYASLVFGKCGTTMALLRQLRHWQIIWSKADMGQLVLHTTISSSDVSGFPRLRTDTHQPTLGRNMTGRGWYDVTELNRTRTDSVTSGWKLDRYCHNWPKVARNRADDAIMCRNWSGSGPMMSLVKQN